MTGRIYIDLFTTLDGVAQAPGGPDEDRESGFPYGGWQAPLDRRGRRPIHRRGDRGAGRARPRPEDVRHLRVVLAGPHRLGLRHRPEVQRDPEVRRVPPSADAGLGGHDAAGSGCRRRGRRAPREARAHPRDRQRRLRPVAARGRCVRRADAVGVPGRARAGQEGVPRRSGARRRWSCSSPRWCRRRAPSCCATGPPARCVRATWAPTTAEPDSSASPHTRCGLRRRGRCGQRRKNSFARAGPEQDESDQHGDA